MKYSDDCKVYRIRYYNVWFYLFAKTEMDEYKINILGERIGMGDSMMMKDIHCWCTRQNIRYRTKFKYRKDYPILANIWNLYSYCLLYTSGLENLTRGELAGLVQKLMEEDLEAG